MNKIQFTNVKLSYFDNCSEFVKIILTNAKLMKLSISPYYFDDNFIVLKKVAEQLTEITILKLPLELKIYQFQNLNDVLSLSPHLKILALYCPIYLNFEGKYPALKFLYIEIKLLKELQYLIKIFPNLVSFEFDQGFVINSDEMLDLIGNWKYIDQIKIHSTNITSNQLIKLGKSCQFIHVLCLQSTSRVPTLNDLSFLLNYPFLKY